ncbi:hypothetical protein [Streptomyces sp. NPDC086787]|uniref:hypothetical protein n=1 Tax=Streptomyces sp. NPDC086787 TaxID=3365759 RepID=UPI0037F2BE5F
MRAARTFCVSAQTVEIAYRAYKEAPKQDNVHAVTSEVQTFQLWAAWREAHRQARIQGSRVRTRENGAPLHPDWTSHRFNRLLELSGLPPIRLLGKTDIKMIQERPGRLPPDHLGHRTRRLAAAPDGRGGVLERGRTQPGRDKSRAEEAEAAPRA